MINNPESLFQLSKKALEKHLETLIRNQALASAHRSASRHFAFSMLSIIITSLYPKTSILLTPAAFYCLVKGTLLGGTKEDSIRCTVDMSENQLHINTTQGHVVVEQLSYYIPNPTASSASHMKDATDSSQPMHENSHEASSTLRAHRGFTI